MRDPVSGLDPAAVAAQVQLDKHPQPALPEAEAFRRGVEEGVAVAQRVAQPTLTLRQRLEALAGGPNLRVAVTPLAEAGQLWDASPTKRGARPHAVLRLTVPG